MSIFIIIVPPPSFYLTNFPLQIQPNWIFLVAIGGRPTCFFFVGVVFRLDDVGVSPCSFNPTLNLVINLTVFLQDEELEHEGALFL